MKLDLVVVNAGYFIMGAAESEIWHVKIKQPDFKPELLNRELPQHRVFLNKFRISTYPITNSDFAEFIQETNYITTAEKENNGFVFNPKFSVVEKAG